MKKIEAKILADSINSQGDRITTYLLTFPRFILAELNTHRVFSKNSASSRAIPFEKMVKMVETDPFIPIAWQKDHKGMQGSEYITDKFGKQVVEEEWLIARDSAIHQAKKLNQESGVTKQLCNRLLEPFMWHTVLLTATEFDNFFKLRCPVYEWEYEEGTIKAKSKEEFLEMFIKRYPTNGEKELHDWEAVDEHFNPVDSSFWRSINKGQAEIHMGALAEAMYDAMNESTPKLLKEGEWHIPFGDRVDKEKVIFLHYGTIGAMTNTEALYESTKIKISTARCARLSYMTFDGEINYEKDLKLHDTLLESHHMSPFEHCARAMSNEEYQFFIKGKGIPDYSLGISSSNPVLTFRKNEEGWCNNFKGFIQYRYLIENDYGK